LTLHIASDSFSAPSADGLIDQVHTHFDGGPAPSDDESCMSRLLVHEWVANLIQHANFEETEPEIAIRFEKSGSSVRYVIEDNSSGFDLDRYLRANESVSEAMPCRGMGLLMLNACSEHLAYRRLGPQRNRLEFVLRPDGAFLDVGV
jgi:serine/threonine-protein kinase RsbW